MSELFIKNQNFEFETAHTFAWSIAMVNNASVNQLFTLLRELHNSGHAYRIINTNRYGNMRRHWRFNSRVCTTCCDYNKREYHSATELRWDYNCLLDDETGEILAFSGDILRITVYKNKEVM